MTTEEETVERTATPIQTVGTIKRVILGLYSYGKPAGGRVLAEHIRMNDTEVGKTLTDAKGLGLVTDEDQHGIYRFTVEGREFAILLSHEREEPSRDLLRNLILSSQLWSDVVSFLASRSGSSVSIDDLIVSVELKHNRSWSSGRRRKAATAFRSILMYARLVDEEDGQLISRVGHPDAGQSTSEARLARLEAPSKVESRQEVFVLGPLGAVKDLVCRVFHSQDGLVVIAIERTKGAVEFLRKHVVPGGPIFSWLEDLEKMLKAEVNANDE